MKPITFEGKTAVITGAGSGMGLLASQELVRMGATVVMCDLHRLKFADTYYGELNHYGMYWLKWADVRR